ncbi:CISD2 [Lepeophtheirus salmonis]|uniref:CDGSH iron-sulfur domain-containing protein 2 homologue n=1 Tax=Lepeophtheirus salmonis TaxID=72036 RepID=A0A7R8D1L1_LEPSM|nr:CISD2 [Lepeophtheirus salmonis]CAF2992396.1 CISD2 [Lepeophtheirus salmonis]
MCMKYVKYDPPSRDCRDRVTRTLKNVDSVKDSLPKYFHSLPIPDPSGGWFSLGIKDWIRLVPIGLTVGRLSFLTAHSVLCCPAIALYIESKFGECCLRKAQYKVNKSIKLDSNKVVDSIDIEDIGDKSVVRRCWKSKKFPYCDVAHSKHSETTVIILGLLLCKRKSRNKLNILVLQSVV